MLLYPYEAYASVDSGVLINIGLPFQNHLPIKSLSIPKSDQEHHSNSLLQGILP